MSNVDHPKGFRAITNQHGTVPQMHEYTVAATTTIYEGSPVALNGDGKAEIYTALLATLFNFIGVAAHGRKSADTSRTLMVYDDDKQEYEAQFDAAAVTNIGALVGRNFSITGGTGGNGTLMQSTAEVDDSTGSAVVYNATLVHPIKGLRFSSDPQNDPSVTWVRAIVRFNDAVHLFSADNAGV